MSETVGPIELQSVVAPALAPAPAPRSTALVLFKGYYVTEP